MHKYKFLLIPLSIVCTACSCFSQSMLALKHENASYLVTQTSIRDYTIETANGSQKILRDEAQVYLTPHSNFLPGFIQIDNESAVDWDSDPQGNSRGDQFFFRYSADITPNRDLKDPFIVFEWVRPDNTALIEIIPLASLNADETIRIAYDFWVRDRFRLVEPSVHVMCMGFEIGTSKFIEKPTTPYEYALQNSAMDTLPDANIAPIQIPPLPKIEDENNNPRKGSAKLIIQIDEKGYVRAMKIREYSEWIFAKAAQMNAPFFMFKPKIEEGKPTKTNILLPFEF